MPKPVKKAAAKKKPSSDPNRRAKQMMAEHLNKLDQGKWAEPEPEPEPTFSPTDDLDTRSIISAYMKVLGAKGGKVSGARRMEMPEKERKAIAKRAAAARWGKKRVEPA